MISLALQFGCSIEMLRNTIMRNSNGAPHSIGLHDDASAFLGIERT